MTPILQDRPETTAKPARKAHLPHCRIAWKQQEPLAHKVPGVLIDALPVRCNRGAPEVF